MSIFTFKGGVHPDDGKALSKEKPIRRFIPSGEMVYPLNQHIGAPAQPIVAVGDEVLVGQKIAKAGGFVSANIHASVSGTVKAIEPRMSMGSKVLSIVIENDGQNKKTAYQAPDLVAGDVKKTIRNAVFEAGIVGMGGANFPTHVKLTPPDDDAIDYIIVNGAECEPYLTSDYRRMLEEPEAVIGGLKYIRMLFPKAEGIIAIEDNKPDVIELMEKMVKDIDGIRVARLKTKYPQGAERMLIYALTGRKVNSSMLPLNAGCIVDNVDTVYAIYRAVKYGKPLTKRLITVTGDAVKEPMNFLVPIGSNQKDIIEAAGGFKEEPVKIISGGPMMGKAMMSLDTPVIKSSSALLCLTKDAVSDAKETNCINCGRCLTVCPGQVAPAHLAKYAERGLKEAFVAHHGMECCECGCCSYVCPAKKNLTQSIASMRKQVLADRKKK